MIRSHLKNTFGRISFVLLSILPLLLACSSSVGTLTFAGGNPGGDSDAEHDLPTYMPDGDEDMEQSNSGDYDADLWEEDKEEEALPDYTDFPSNVPLVGQGDRYASILIDLDTLDFDIQPGFVEGAAIHAICFADDSDNPLREPLQPKGMLASNNGWQAQSVGTLSACGEQSAGILALFDKERISWICPDGLCRCTSRITYFLFDNDDNSIVRLRFDFGLDCDANLLLLESMDTLLQE